MPPFGISILLTSSRSSLPRANRLDLRSRIRSLSPHTTPPTDAEREVARCVIGRAAPLASVRPSKPLRGRCGLPLPDLDQQSRVPTPRCPKHVWGSLSLSSRALAVTQRFFLLFFLLFRGGLHETFPNGKLWEETAGGWQGLEASRDLGLVF